jgi:hypothetical protein
MKIYSDKSTLQLTMSNQFGSSAFGTSTKNFSVGLNSSNRFTEQWYLNLGVNYRSSDYIGSSRSDDYLEGNVGVSYVYNNYLNFDASVSLRKNDSTTSSADFTNNIFSLGANVRY